MPLLLALFAVVLVPLAACTKSHPGSPVDPQASPAAKRVVNLAIWSNYLSPEAIQKFEKDTGIQVQVSNYASNEELLAKLQAGATGYDVIVPSDYMVGVMAAMGLLKELDRKKLTHFRSLDPEFLAQAYDPSNKFSVPYTWGTTGIAVNRSLYRGKIRGWKDLFEAPELAGKFTMLDDAREGIAAALKASGLSLNSRKPEDLEKAKALLLKARPRVRGFSSETLMALVNGETPVAHAYMSDALQARARTGGQVEYVIPVEGSTLWVDNLAVPASAPHLEEAHLLIDYFLNPKTNASTVQAVFVAPCNRDAQALLPAGLRRDSSLFPSATVKKTLEMMTDLGEAVRDWDRVWTELKTAS